LFLIKEHTPTFIFTFITPSAGQDHMGAIGISRAVRREGTDGLVGLKIWKCGRSQGREGMVSIFIFLIESRTLVPIYLPGWREWKQPTFGTYLHL